MLLIEVLHFVSASFLALMGFHALFLSIVYLLRRKPEPGEVHEPDIWPEVTIQLPIYNEKYVVERLITACCSLDYPADRLVVQILDDSTDETSLIIAAIIDRMAGRKIRIEHVRRENRTGYKAGALAIGLERTDTPFIVILDADFMPAPDFLRKTIPYLLADDQVGVVQARWGHINPTTNLLTRIQTLGLDSHFVVEQTARSAGGFLLNFSGSAGVWRRECIEKSGGWQSDTLSEDIDLSYRAQLQGWRCVYLPDVGVPAGLTPLMMALKKQQARWATGTIQCLLKHSRTVISSDLSIGQKIEAILHLGGYLVHPFMLIWLLTLLPLMSVGKLNMLSLAGLSLSMFGPPIQALISQRTLYPDWKTRIMFYPFLMLLGVGIAVSNTAAVIRGLVPGAKPFERTPKHFMYDTKSRHEQAYQIPVDMSVWVEIVCALYASVSAAVALKADLSAVPFLLLYSTGLLMVAGMSLWQDLAYGRGAGGRSKILHTASSQS